MGKYLREWFKDPIFGLVLLAACIVVFSLFVASLKDKARERAMRRQVDRARKLRASARQRKE